MRKRVLVIHGGAGVVQRHAMTATDEAAYRAGLTAALERGLAILQRDGSSLDAVQAAVEVLENSPLFNAGRGSVLTSAGTHELEASIMQGHTLAAGAVTGLQRIEHPIALARLVLERSPHVMLAGAGAEAFAESQGMSFVAKSHFFTQRRWESLQRAKETDELSAADQHGTVGAVALDAYGHLAAATSTGGLTNKAPGRIGDSPIIGAGTYADRQCAVSATGHGEFFIRHAVAHDICARVRYTAQPIAQAAGDVIHHLDAQGAQGGVIAVTAAGDVAMPFSGEGMFRGVATSEGVMSVAIYRE